MTKDWHLKYIKNCYKSMKTTKKMEKCYKKAIHAREKWMAKKTWKNVQPYQSNKKLIHNHTIKYLRSLTMLWFDYLDKWEPSYTIGNV